MGHLRIASSPCNECLFSKNKVVSDERRDDILAECAEDDSHFICHKFTLAVWLGQLTDEQANVCCNGFYRNDPNATQWMQIAGRLDLIRFVDLPEEDVSNV